MSITIGIGKNLKITPGGSVYERDPDLVVYLTGLTTALSEEQITRLETFLLALKLGLGIALLNEFFDWMYIFAGETQESSLRNLVKRAHDSSLINAPLWTQWEGVTGANTKYIDTNYDGSTDMVVPSRNDASYGLYFRKNGVSGGYHGATSNTNSRHCFMIPVLAGNYYLRLHSTVNYTVPNANSQGFFIGQRPDASNLEISINGAALTSTANASTFVQSGNIFILARNNSGVAGDYSTNQVSFGFFGKRMTQSQINIMVTTFEAYMDSLGKGILP